MNLLDYLKPPNIDSYQLKKSEFYSSITSFRDITNGQIDLSKIEVALLGVPFAEDNSYHSTFVDSVRHELSELAAFQNNTSILDAGNLIQGKTLNDSLIALKDVIRYLHKHNIFIIALSNLNLVQKIFIESLKDEKSIKVAEVASKFSLYETMDYLSQSSLEQLHYTNIGYQSYYIHKESFNWLHENNFDAYRLGEVRKNLSEIEPAIRDSLLFNISLNALKHTDAPGQNEISPNGFYSEEICQIAKYAGVADFLRLANISGFGENTDVTTIKLTAQIIWFTIAGYGLRITEDPTKDLYIKKFNVNLSGSDSIVFYKSDKTERWWIEVPLHSIDQPFIIPSNYKDYIEACNHQIPERFLKAMQKYNFR